MKIIGISSFYHDSAAALVIDGEIISASQEERFSRIKNDKSFPRFAIASCLDQANLKISEIDFVAFYENPYKSFKRMYENLFVDLNNLIFQHKNLKQWGYSRLRFQDFFKDIYPHYEGDFFFSDHHISHAASAFYPSGFDDAAILTIDGVGENTTATICHGKVNNIKKLVEMQFPHSLGLLYTCITTYLGFKANSGEYKVMGLAPYGDPSKFQKIIEDNLVKINKDGSIFLDLEFFDFKNPKKMYTNKLNKLLGFNERRNEKYMLQKVHMDIAASLQVVTEKIVIRMANHSKKLTNAENLCMAGGVALNCVANGKLQRSNIFKNIWIQPASSDSGNAIGAALNLYFTKKDRKKLKYHDSSSDFMKNSLLGPSYSDQEIKCFLDSVDANYIYIPDDNKLIQVLIEKLLDGKIFGLFRGRMEFGPRALGSRSIIGDPRRQDTQTKMNLKIKFRESFRPFAPFVLKEFLNEWFADSDLDNKYMLFVSELLSSKRINIKDKLTDNNILQYLNQPRSLIPAVTHVDYSARVQTISKENNPFIYKLLIEFYKETNIPVLVNTSFNVRGEPIVCTPFDAYNCLINTYMDCLCIGNYFLYREDQKLPNLTPEDIQNIKSLKD